MIEPSETERAELPETSAAYIADLERENERLRTALKLIELYYHMEGGCDRANAAYMNWIARDALSGNSIAWAERAFPRHRMPK